MLLHRRALIASGPTEARAEKQSSRLAGFASAGRLRGRKVRPVRIGQRRPKERTPLAAKEAREIPEPFRFCRLFQVCVEAAGEMLLCAPRKPLIAFRKAWLGYAPHSLSD